MFLKYVIKNMFEKKSQFFLLFLAITMSTSLFVASVGSVNVLISTASKPIIESYEGKNIEITPKDSKSAFFSISSLDEDGIKGLIPQIEASGINDSKNYESVSIIGRKNGNIDFSSLLNRKEITGLSNKDCIISKRVADDFELKTGDSLKIILYGEKQTLNVVGIAANSGIFYKDQKQSFSLIVGYNYLAKKCNAEGKYNYVTATGTQSSIQDSINKFNSANADFKAEKLYSDKLIEAQVSQYANIFYIMLAIVVLMSMIIIYSSFKLIVTERLPVIGTFLSQGATKGKVKRILYLESISYGLIGGITGDALGTGILAVINYETSPLKDYGIVTPFQIFMPFLAEGILFSVVVSLVSALIPVLRIQKLQVKDVILNIPNATKDESIYKGIVGAAFIVIAIVLCVLFSKQGTYLNLAELFLIILGTLLLVPFIINKVSVLICKAVRNLSTNLYLAVNNIRTSKILIGNINLIVVAILCVVLINSLGNSIKIIVADCYSSLNYDLAVYLSPNMDKSSSEKFINGVKDKYNIAASDAQTIYYLPSDIDSNSVLAVESDKYKDYMVYLDFDGYNKDAYDRFENGGSKEAIVSNNMAKHLNIKEGDNFILELSGLKLKFHAISVIDGKLYNGGSFIFIKQKGLPETIRNSTPSAVIFKTGSNVTAIKKYIKEQLKPYGATVFTKAEECDRNMASNAQMIFILNVFSFLAVIIGAFGILNNVRISFIKRKKELAVLSSCGMGKGKRTSMLLIESVMTVVWATIISIPASYLLMPVIGGICRAIGFDVDISFNIGFMPIIFIASAAIILLATIPALLRNRKLSIVQELKYE